MELFQDLVLSILAEGGPPNGSQMKGTICHMSTLICSNIELGFNAAEPSLNVDDFTCQIRLELNFSNHPCLQFTSTLRSWFDLDGNAFVQGLCNCFLRLSRVFSEWPNWYSHSHISFQLPLVGKDRMTFPILPTMMAVEELPKDFEFSCKMSSSCYC